MCLSPETCLKCWNLFFLDWLSKEVSLFYVMKLWMQKLSFPIIAWEHRSHSRQHYSWCKMFASRCLCPVQKERTNNIQCSIGTYCWPSRLSDTNPFPSRHRNSSFQSQGIQRNRPKEHKGTSLHVSCQLHGECFTNQSKQLSMKRFVRHRYALHICSNYQGKCVNHSL